MKKNDTISSFVKGAKEGISTIFSITPNILAIMVAVALFRQSGALNYLITILTPTLSFLRVPSGIIELILLRPVSGSGSIVLLTDVFKNFTPDSKEGIMASIICASTETTLYTIMLYFGVTKVTKTKFPLILGLTADAIVVALSILLVNLFLFQ